MVLLKDINLIPKSVRVRKQKADSLRLVLISVSVLLGFLLIIDGTILFVHSNKQKDISAQQNRINELQIVDVNEDVLNTVRSKIQNRENIIKSISDNQTNMTKVTDEIAQLLPEGVSLVSLKIDEKRSVQMQAKADTEELILQFYHNLKNSNLSDYIEFNRITGRIGDTVKGFEFVFTFNLKTGSDIK